ncbi:MAG: endonuclease [Oscillospiraceae bacterium]|nr:endonuclease [Oscillospiraceae bacterium]
MAKHVAKPKHDPVKTGIKIVLIILAVILVLLALMILFLSVTEYKPADREDLALEGKASAGKIKIGEKVKVMSWNIGYCALGDNADFFMDGGKMVNTADDDRVLENIANIIVATEREKPDLILYQEVDRSSSRSHRENEVYYFTQRYSGFTSSFANNFKVLFLPYPIPPIGKVDSGLLTFSSFEVKSAERVQLPIPFAWPVRMANLKRCLNIQRLPVEGSSKELVLVNLHLEAYDDGEGKAAQTEMLRQILVSEAEKGNYVIAGGDFNQIFSTADKAAYPAQPGKWAPGEIDVSVFPGSWGFLMDSSVPSCRSLDQPYTGAVKDGFQYYLIDGFIVSDNVTVSSFRNLDLDFANSDHNPAVLEFVLK